MPVCIDEGQDFRDRRIRPRQMPDLVQTLGKQARAMKQLLIKRPHNGQACVRELAALHAGDVEAGETSRLPGRNGKRDHVATHAANGANHCLLPDPDKLMGRRKITHGNKIADLAMAAQRGGSPEDHVVADLAVVTDMAAVHEVAAFADARNAASGDGACVHGGALPDGAALADLKPRQLTAITQGLRRRPQ